MGKNLIIEITGVPGSGKSTFLKKSFNMLAKDYPGLISDTEAIKDIIGGKFNYRGNNLIIFKILLWITFISKYPISYFKYAKFHIYSIYIVFKYDRRRKAFLSYFRKFSKFYLLKCAKHYKVITDEGIVHIAFSLFVRTISINEKMKLELIKFFQLVPVPTIIYLKRPPLYNELKKRISERGHHRLDNVRHSKKKTKKKRKEIDPIKLEVFIANNIIIGNIMKQTLSKRVRIIEV